MRPSMVHRVGVHLTMFAIESRNQYNSVDRYIAQMVNNQSFQSNFIKITIIIQLVNQSKYDYLSGDINLSETNSRNCFSSTCCAH
jgi:hypothetical protein